MVVVLQDRPATAGDLSAPQGRSSVAGILTMVEYAQECHACEIWRKNCTCVFFVRIRAAYGGRASRNISSSMIVLSLLDSQVLGGAETDDMG